jgi:hypothetical protein
MRISKWMALPAALVAATALSVNIEAAPKTNKASGPKTTKTTKTTTTSSPKGKTTSTGEVSKAKGPKTKTTTTTASNSSSTKKSSASTKKNASSTTSTETTPTTTTTSTGTTWEPTNAVAEKLMGKPNQLAKAKAVLPAGTDINDATAGFKNFGQFNAAVNVSQNLGIDFADLKSAMTGITLEGDKTNEPTKSLGQAIKQYRPGVDAEAEAALATSQAAQ